MAETRLLLTGFMGAGKTTAGAHAARRLEVPLYDSDDWLEEVMGINIEEQIKKDRGKFRELELEAIRQILEREPGVIATGGGIVETEMGRAVLMQLPVAWLNVDFEVAKRRVLADTGRPRALFEDPEAALALYEQRQPWYLQTATVDPRTDKPLEANANRHPVEVSEELIRIAHRAAQIAA